MKGWLARSGTVAVWLACSCSSAGRDQPARAPVVPATHFELPAALAGDHDAYVQHVSTAMDEVGAFFRSVGLELPSQPLIDSVTVFETSPQARAYLSKQYGVPIDGIPESFAGTVNSRTLLLISEAAYRDVWRKTYPDWPWTDQSYHQLIVHELGHRGHEALVIARFGTSDAMGPPWFFEGLAVVCAGQFATDSLLTLAQLKEEIGGGRTPAASYPAYGRIVRSLAAIRDMRTLVEDASRSGFPDSLWSPSAAYTPRP